ncbi:hypothetical protein F4811DRAFT_572542 [Daldinia bambusicola]|nr:hypothetical protein F4811DRAFT_572542 [Daldinia bambusicola]
MPAIPRQKACIACADAKRRCDKQLPECRRCLDRDVDCVYPQPKRRRRDPPASISINQPGDILPVPNPVPADADADADVPLSGLNFADWGAIGAADLDVSLSDVLMPLSPPEAAYTHTHTHTANQPAPRMALPRDGDDDNDTPGTTMPSGGSGAWFLGDETWVLQHNPNKPPKTSTNVELEPFIRAVEEMLHSWVRNGHNSFIHRRLYNSDGADMPACLEDAFTTLATYVGRAPAVHDAVLRIAERRSSALAAGCQRDCCTSSTSATGEGGGGAQGIRAQLARVHALFVYQFILLFDGSVRSRAHAEKQQPTLRRWVKQLCAAARVYRGEDLISPQNNDPDNNGNSNSNSDRPASFEWWALGGDFNRDYEAAAGLWRLWILIESVRRSQLIVDTVCNVYDTLTKGWAECTGAVKFTARRGLWEADSAMGWFELSSAEEPLLVPSLEPGLLISQHSADEFDDLVKVLWTCVIGTDKMKSWIDRSNKALRV